jgi:peptidoglycan/xylan/chitin deacetylase (PgdA/CDA1 family)
VSAVRRLKTFARRLTAAAVERSPLGGRVLFRLPPAAAGVALTFDDGPDPDGTPPLLDLLARHGVRATFFVVGKRAAEHPGLLRRIAAAGHALGNHTFSHVDCRRLGPDQLVDELARTDRAVRDAGLEAAALPFRPPWGRLTLRQYRRVAADRPVVLWSVNPYDFCSTPDQIVRACAGAGPRDVVLLHDRKPQTREALPAILERLAARGLPTVTLAPS